MALAEENWQRGHCCALGLWGSQGWGRGESSWGKKCFGAELESGICNVRSGK